MTGYYGDEERIDQVLRGANTISVRDKMEQVDDSQCYVIDAVAKSGRYTVWIDPQYGYNIAKLDILKRENDWMHGRRIVKGEEYFSSLKNMNFKKINDMWVPMESDYRLSTQLPKGHWAKPQKHIERTEVILNPDHDALGSFITDDILNGTEVLIAEVEGISYTWQDGKVIDKKGRVIADFRKKTDKSQKEGSGDAKR
ncbi:MAG: hypothetical protein A2167_01330 [Planctomycetes bacterium RBG_13_46_10]|nr:MAG: hypothetical protein A2167_01330 [Planctomycetes bacterium RBG_13_46_10]